MHAYESERHLKRRSGQHTQQMRRRRRRRRCRHRYGRRCSFVRGARLENKNRHVLVPLHMPQCGALSANNFICSMRDASFASHDTQRVNASKMKECSTIPIPLCCILRTLNVARFSPLLFFLCVFLFLPALWAIYFPNFIACFQHRIILHL